MIALDSWQLYYGLEGSVPPRTLSGGVGGTRCQWKWQDLRISMEGVCVCVVCVCAQSCLTLCNPMDCSPPGSSVHGISQARLLEWVAMLTQRSNLPLLLDRRTPYHLHHLWSVALWVTFLHSSPSTPGVATFFMWTCFASCCTKALERNFWGFTTSPIRKVRNNCQNMLQTVLKLHL